MTQSWSPPPLQPFQRLHVTDGLLMNAERWRLAHQYHRQHHSFQYQALHEPGIIYGLGVRVIDPPQVRSQYRDRRWLEVQPGIAIDHQGNFIVVTEPISFRLASVNYQETPLTVYLVIRHVDPETLRQKSETALLKESFRLDEKSTPPQASDVELCRFTLPPHDAEGNDITLQTAVDVFAPAACEPNFLERPRVRSRPQGFIRIGIEAHSCPADGVNPFTPLLEAVELTATQLRGVAVSAPINPDPDRPPDCELLYVALTPETTVDDTMLGAWRAYVEIGGTLFFELQGWSNDCNEQLTVYRELQQAIAEAADDPELAPVRVELAGEFRAVQQQLVTQLLAEYPAFPELSRQFESPLLPLLTHPHPLRSQPFRFDTLPIVEGIPTFWAVGVGWVVSLGQLSSAWQFNRPYPLGTATIRLTQELGLNLLHFAWRRKQLTACQQTPTLPMINTSPAVMEAGLS
ncbi:MAG: hypothetical protein F6J87_13315 [Spirulina sp. SIO3F2]|nr:hypothetical protein [Spirulina sp. SIO3F2]